MWQIWETKKQKKSFLICKEKNVEISSLAFYPNTMDGNLEKRAANIEHLYKVIDASKKLGINLVTTFIGRDQTKTVEENLELVKEIWTPDRDVTQKKRKLRIAIENCPMLFGRRSVARWTEPDDNTCNLEKSI